VIFSSFRLLLLMEHVKNITDRNTDNYVADNRMPAKPPVQVTACAKWGLLVSSSGHFSDNGCVSVASQTTEAQGISFVPQ
jgi:hypothetical protein